MATSSNAALLAWVALFYGVEAGGRAELFLWCPGARFSEVFAVCSLSNVPVVPRGAAWTLR